MGAAEKRYSSIAIILHWVMAALIIFMIWLGHNMESHEARFQLHKSIGITLLILTIARIAWRIYNKPPPLPSDIKRLESRTSKLVQFGFYALMLGIPLGGWLLVSVSPFAVPTVLFETISWPNLPVTRNEETYKLLASLHGKGATIGFLSLLLLHVAGAIKHQVGHEDGVLKRMLPGPRTASSEKSRGILPTLLTSLGFFIVVAAIPLFSQNGSWAKPTNASNVDIIPNWVVVDKNKSISFSFSHDDGDYTGHFENWEAKIEFSEDDLDNSQVFVDIDLNSALTGTKLYDDSLRMAEWFDVKTNPKAKVRLRDFKSNATNKGYTAEAELELKGIQVRVPFTFDLQIEGDYAKMTGRTTLTRKELNIGQVSDPDAEWVSEQILIDVSFDAKRKAR